MHYILCFKYWDVLLGRLATAKDVEQDVGAHLMQGTKDYGTKTCYVQCRRRDNKGSILSTPPPARREQAVRRTPRQWHAPRQYIHHLMPTWISTMHAFVLPILSQRLMMHTAESPH